MSEEIDNDLEQLDEWHDRDMVDLLKERDALKAELAAERERCEKTHNALRAMAAIVEALCLTHCPVCGHSHRVEDDADCTLIRTQKCARTALDEAKE